MKKPFLLVGVVMFIFVLSTFVFGAGNPKSPAVAKKGTKAAETYELAPKELNFELTKTKIVFPAEGGITADEFEDFKCNDKTIAVTSNQIKNGFISTRDFGQIKIELHKPPLENRIVIKTFITQTQKALLLRHGFAQESHEK